MRSGWRERAVEEGCDTDVNVNDYMKETTSMNTVTHIGL